MLTPFVYRRYLDYGVFDALRQMKTLIAQEVARKDMADNIKLGPGGIREIEFIAQAFQLVRGGRRPELRTRSLLQASAAARRRPAARRQHASRRSRPRIASCARSRTASRRSTIGRRTSCRPSRRHARASRTALGEPSWAAFEERLAHQRARRRERSSSASPGKPKGAAPRDDDPAGDRVGRGRRGRDARGHGARRRRACRRAARRSCGTAVSISAWTRSAASASRP